MSLEQALAANSMDPILRAIVTVGVLIFFAKIFASMFSSLRLPPVVVELLARVIFSPYALGGGIIVSGEPLVVLNDYMEAFAEIGAMLKLRSGVKSARVGVGMIPRGELGLIITSLALSKGVIGQDLDAQAI